MVLNSVIMGQFIFRVGLQLAVAIAGGLAVGTYIRFVNGLPIARVKLPPLIVTLGIRA